MSLKSQVVSSKNQMEQIGTDIKNTVSELKNGCWEGPAFLSFSSKIESVDSKINMINSHFEIYSAVAEIVEALELIIERLESLNKLKVSLDEPNAELNAEIVELETEKKFKINNAIALLNGINDIYISPEVLMSATTILNGNIIGDIKSSIAASKFSVVMDKDGDGIVDKGDVIPRNGTREEKLNYLFPNGRPRSVSEAKRRASQYIVTTNVDIINENGERTSMKLSVHKELEEDVKEIFSKIADTGFKVKVGTTGAFNPRNTSKGVLSHHSYGTAIDINWNDNPYLHYDRSGTKYSPDKNDYAITEEVADIFRSYGWSWGGSDWGKDSTDYMHFSFTELGSQGHKVEND